MERKFEMFSKGQRIVEKSPLTVAGRLLKKMMEYTFLFFPIEVYAVDAITVAKKPCKNTQLGLNETELDIVLLMNETRDGESFGKESNLVF